MRREALHLLPPLDLALAALRLQGRPRDGRLLASDVLVGAMSGLRFTAAQAQSLGLLPAPPVRRGRKTHTADGHAIDPAFVGIRESGRDGFQADVMKLARRGGWTCGQDDEADLPGLTYHALRGMGATERGWPDLVLLRRRDGRVLFRELKAENGEPTLRQMAVLDLLRACGLDAAIWRPSQLEAIAEVLR